MADKFVIGKGATIGYSVDGSSYALVAQVLDCSLGLEVKTAESTHLASTNPTYVPTLPAATDCSFSVEFDVAQHATLTGLMLAPANSFWEITLSDSTSIKFEGILDKLDISGVEVEGIVQADCNIKLNTLWTIA